jgi:protein RecA
VGRKKSEYEPDLSNPKGIADHINNVVGIPGMMALGNDPRFLKPKIDPKSWIIRNMLLGGYRRGRMFHFFGPEGVGKSMVAMLGLAGHQEWAKVNGEDPVVAIFDYENAFDEAFARFLGIDMDYCLVGRPEYGDKGFDAIQAMAMSGKVQAAMVDSIAAMLPKHDLARALEDKSMGELASMMSRGLRKIVTANDNMSIFWINQIREKLGVMFGSPTTTPGGKAMGFYCSVNLEFRYGAKGKQRVDVLDAGKGELGESYEEMEHEIRLISKKDRTGSRKGTEASVWWHAIEHPDGPGIYEWDELWILSFMYCGKCLQHIGDHGDQDHSFEGIIRKDARTYYMPTLGVDKIVGWDDCRAEVKNHPERIQKLREMMSKAIDLRQSRVYRDPSEEVKEEMEFDQAIAEKAEEEEQEVKEMALIGASDEEGFEPA